MDTRPEFHKSPCLDFEQLAGHTLYRARLAAEKRGFFPCAFHTSAEFLRECVRVRVRSPKPSEQFFGFPKGGSLNKLAEKISEGASTARTQSHPTINYPMETTLSCSCLSLQPKCEGGSSRHGHGLRDHRQTTGQVSMCVGSCDLYLYTFL